MASYEKLKLNRDFGRVYRRGHYVPGRLVVLHQLAAGRSRPTRVGFAVSRQIRGAVSRNRVKRRLREALRTLEGTLNPGYDLVLTAKPRVADVSFQTLTSELKNLLERADLTRHAS